MTQEKCQSVRRTHTVHAAYCHREEGHNGPCSFADGNGMHFWLDAYEVSNLREAMKAIHEAKLWPLMNGDWFEQVRSKISNGFILPNNPPNRKADEIVEQLKDNK